MAKSKRELAQDAVNFFLSRKEGVGDRTSQAFNLQNQLLGNDIFQQQQFKPALGEIFDYDTKGFTEDFLKADPKGGLFKGEGQDDKIQKTLDLLDEYKDQGTIPLELRRILERAKQRAEQGEQISFNLQNSPFFQKQSGVVGFPEFQVASLGDLTGILSSTPAQTAAGQTPVQQAIAQQQAETQQKIIDEVKETGGGGGPAGMVGTPTGPGQTGGPAGMGFAPARTPEPPPFRRFNTGGLAKLEGDTTQNNPNMLPPFAGRRGPFPVGGGGGLASILQPGFPFRPPGFDIIQPMPFPGPQLPQMPDYSNQFEKLGETLGGFGEQLGGFGKQIDALGSFNEQVGGLGKQFESVNNKLDSLEKGLGSLGNQLASIEQGQPKPQEVQQPQQPSYSPFGLANLFMNMRRF